MSENIFFDADIPTEIDEAPIDLSNVTKAEIIPHSSVLLRLSIEGTDFQRQFAASEITDEDKHVDFELINTSKRMIDKKYLDPVKKLDGRMRTILYQIGLRPPFLDAGNIIVPLRLLTYLVKKIDEYKIERNRLVEEFIDTYEAAKLETKERSPDLYREEEYPSADTIRSKFQVGYNIYSVAFPDVLDRLETETVKEVGEKVDKQMDVVRAETRAVLIRQRAEQEKQLTEAVTDIQMGLRAGFYSLIDRLEDKVKGVGSERKVFKPGFISEFRTFLETFDAKNITNDEELKKMVDRARAVLNGVSPDAIRNSLDVRVKLEDELGSIKKDLDSMVTPMVRKASFR